MGLDAARDAARAAMLAIKRGKSTAGPEPFESVANDWLKRHVDAKGLVCAEEVS
jgi:hypothetical protein